MRDLTEACTIEFERAVERLVEREFEARRRLPDENCEVPAIGGTYDPHAPREQHADLKQRVIRALCARKWFESEAPKFCQPLPLSERERVRLNGSSDRRLGVVANYGMLLQGMGWHYERAPSFFDYIQQSAPR